MQATTFPRLAIATAISLSFVHAQAEDGASDLDGEQVATLDPVVVTATRTPQTTDQLLSATTIIERDDIERSQVNDLPGLLARQPGLNVTREGPYGQRSALFMRGTNSDHSLVMVNGMRMGSATAGTASFEHIPLHDLERIEIVRGPRSSIYGADAIGGVVQMFTRGERMFEGQRLRGGMMAGSHSTSEVTAGLDAGDGQREVSVSARKFDTDGIRAGDASVSRNGFENNSASLRYGQQLGPDVRWDLNAMHSRGTAEFGNAFVDGDQFDEFVQQAISTEFDIQASQWWQVNLRAGQSKDERDTFTDTAPDELVSRFDTRRDELNWRNQFFVGEHNEIIAGVDLRESHVDSTTDFEEDSRYNAGAFGVYLFNGERTDFEISTRRDKNEAFGYSTTGGIAGGYRIGETTRVRGSVGTAFKAPSFNDLFFPGFSNPDLNPEESISYEIGLEGGRDMHWGINVFRTEIDELIALDENFVPQNVEEATIDGVELTSTALDVDGWRLQASATWQDPVAKGLDGAEDTKLPRRPQRKFTFDADRDIGRGSLGLTARHESSRFDDAANQTEVDAFTLIDLRVGYKVARNVQLRGSIENVGDVEYQTVEGFNNPGRTFFVRLEYRG